MTFVVWCEGAKADGRACGAPSRDRRDGLNVCGNCAQNYDIYETNISRVAAGMRLRWGRNVLPADLELMRRADSVELALVEAYGEPAELVTGA